MSGMGTYKKKIEAYIKQRMAEGESTQKSKGLLAPTGIKPADVKKEKDAIEKVSEFVYALRQKRREIVTERNKK